MRVLDLTSTMSGPFCTLLLAQLGAFVDKVEPPTGDVLRRVPGGKSPTMSPMFLAFNAGKRSIALDLGVESNRELLRRSFARYDVIVHNMRPSAASRIGLTTTDLTEMGATAVLCEIVGYGPGPLQDQPAYDDTIQAASGMAWVQGNGAAPEYVRTAIADKTAGIYAALAVCAELAGRAAGGAPRSVKIPMLETLAAYTTIEQLGGLTFDPPTGPALYARTASPDRRPYATADGHISVMIYTDRHWRAFLAEVGQADLVTDPRFATLEGRTTNIDEVYAFVAEHIGRRTTADWITTLRRIDVPHASVNSIGALFDDEQLAAVGMFPLKGHPTEGLIQTARSPFLFDDQPLSSPGYAERLGASTASFIDEQRARTAEG
ncbi:CaiB/BaiF CoA transferase family protein [Diaminobutyricibacter sp. McL0618]|uniref:CaiB/BaiF CoA transferase family protein n=1 Tax=Leifsonia sp. McL0618 TaxID=3415677 RepID=UPI003CE9939D